MKIKEEVLKVKGDKDTFVNSTLEAHIDKDTGYLHLKKGFMGLVLSRKQSRKLAKWLYLKTSTKKGVCIICNKKDDYSGECVCGNCSLKWLEKKGKLKDYIKRIIEKISDIILDRYPKDHVTISKINKAIENDLGR